MGFLTWIKEHIRKNKNYIFVMLLAVTVSFITLTVFDNQDSSIYRKKMLSNIRKADSFNSFQDDLFRYEVTSNSITTAYNLRHPENYNIPVLNPVLTDFSYKDYASDYNNNISKKKISKISEKLTSFKNDDLSVNDRITYDLIQKYLKSSYDFYDYPYYESLLGKTTGVAANLPVTFSEFPLNTTSDIETYLTLFKQVPTFFDNIIKYENERIKHDMGTPVFMLKQTENQLTDFIKNLKTDNNCFITTFEERTKHTEGLTQKERSKYISNNKYYVNYYIVPAYERLLKYIHAKTTLSDNFPHPDLPAKDIPYGICIYPKGKEYYQLVVKNLTGSDKTVPELTELTDKSLNNALSDVLRIATTDTDAYMYYCDHPVETGYHSPEGILDALSLMIRDDYPILKSSVGYNVKTVPGALAEMVSPAFYMIPAIDDYENNTIYINPLYTSEENGNLFTTLAHEGFPGHLYQTVYFNSLNPAPIRQILDYPGYVEGWATYVELNSFSLINYTKYKESLPILYRSDAIINLALSTRIDIGVNYEGWTLEDTCRYFEELGFNSYYAPDIYSYVVESPGNYLSYFIGYLEIEDLKQEYRNLKMENYTDNDFHKALVDIGPADFETIRKYMFQ
ncbi:MAG: DUF885 domain-containing protein [Lachnospiraceae bacterium]|nr:DUF885 domain-containing protein [Lachnospiraceae bacterium]